MGSRARWRTFERDIEELYRLAFTAIRPQAVKAKKWRVSRETRYLYLEGTVSLRNLFGKTQIGFDNFRIMS